MHDPSHPVPSYMQPQWFFPLFALMWLGIGALLARLGGWSTLAGRFRATEPASGERFHFVSGRMGGVAPVNFGNCLFVTVSDRGFHLSVLFLFRVLSPPLFIPWSEVTSVEVRRFLFTRSAVICVRDAWPVIWIRGRAGERIKGEYDLAAARGAGASALPGAPYR